jgi:hypothetical protein
VTVVVLALLAGGVWWQRERIGDLVDRARGELTEEGAAAPPDPTSPEQTGPDTDQA